MILSKANASMEKGAITALEKDRFYQRIITKWLKGYSIHDIAFSEGGMTNASVIQAINIKRRELVETQAADIEQLAAERIAGLKVIQKEAFDYLEYYPEKASQLLTVALRSEETQARIQGVLNEKVMHLGRITHEVKLYDFSDNTPNAVIIDAVVQKPSFILQEAELPPIDQVEEIDTERVKVIIPNTKTIDEVIEIPQKVKKVPKAIIVNSVTIIRPGDAIFE